MTDQIYHLLNRMGYDHPIHPPLTHMLIGLVVGAFIFNIISILFKRPSLEQTARHCIFLAYLFLFPMALLGYLDWQHYFAGAWLHPIKIKLTLTAVFFILSSLAILLSWKFPRSKANLALYSLCFLTLTGLGYYGGDLAFGCRSPTAPEEYGVGAKIFSTECSSCHPQGGNIITPNMPLRGAPQLANYEAFVAFLRNPALPDGSKGVMPNFPPEKISDQEQKDLYEYIMNVLENPRKH